MMSLAEPNSLSCPEFDTKVFSISDIGNNCICINSSYIKVCENILEREEEEEPGD